MFISSKFMTELMFKKKAVPQEERIKSSMEIVLDDIILVLKEKGLYDNLQIDINKAKEIAEKEKTAVDVYSLVIKYCELANIEVPATVLKLMKK